MLGTCTVTEEIAYHSSSMAGVYDGQCILVPQTLTFAGDELRSRLIPELTSGRVAFSFATTEPETSSDLTAERMQTVAEETPDGFVVTGRERWITNRRRSPARTATASSQVRNVCTPATPSVPGREAGLDPSTPMRAEVVTALVVSSARRHTPPVRGEPRGGARDVGIARGRLRSRPEHPGAWRRS